MNIKYRPATEADKEKIIKLDKAASDEELARYSQEKKNLFDVDEYFQSGGCFWVAEDGVKVVGMIGVRFLGGGKAKVKALRVHPDYRGQGIAKQLMNTLEDYSKEHGIKELVLGVNNKSTPAIKLYESLGYVIVEEKEVRPGVVARYFKKGLK